MAACDQDSDGSSSGSGFGEDEYDDFANEDWNDDVLLHPLLQDDINRMQEMYPENTISCRVLPGISDMILSVHIPTSVLQRDTAAAWNLNHEEPLTICISLDSNLYLDVTNFQKIEVFQESASKRGGTIQQLQTIANSFCQSSLQDLTNEKVSSAISQNKRIRYADVVYLMEMGFLECDARKALEVTNGDKEKAINFLLQETEIPLTDSSKMASTIKPYSICLEKPMPSLENGFLVQLYEYMSQRLLTLNNYCPICDNPHDLHQIGMLKPCICHRELCIFSFTTLGLLWDTGVCLTEPKVTDLLIHLTRSAAQSQRHDIVLTPYPAFVDPTKPNELAMHEKCRDIELLRSTLDHIPQAEEFFNNCPENDVKAKLDRDHPLCLPLIRWIINSNRSHIVALPKQKQVKLMKTNHQFLMRSMPPLEEKTFIEKRKKYGSTFAFHGSPIENWHAIIREGLIVASGTAKQLHGASLGKAIYLSPLLGTSIGYCGYHGIPLYMKLNEDEAMPELRMPYLCGDLTCIALCEVIKDDHLKRHGEIWTCLESSSVCTRLFFVYDLMNPASNIQKRYVSTAHPDLLAQIKQAVKDVS